MTFLNIGLLNCYRNLYPGSNGAGAHETELLAGLGSDVV
jgi:hypothetical protein